ncbi:LAQU0S04e02454g1_1 [Lachancea quebecensis]|uniref:LAQU0S04e02454g1_1 n=1 Tax=Lachancea quebecensis TaxID=1654605 RepID=A0A0N7MLC0_9SACH|nr:LAQU0S04e02454g1_1 [Lachancea quebecensis]
MAHKRQFSLEASKMLKRKSSEIFRSLPKVPTTQYLEPAELTRDILYSGYRPVIYPVKENPLFKEAGWKTQRLRSEHGVGKRSTVSKSGETGAMAGPLGTGGIGSGGVNGTWRYNPRIPSKLLPYNLWSCTSMAMEYHPEWLAVPRTVVNKLRPFESPHKPVAEKKADCKVGSLPTVAAAAPTAATTLTATGASAKASARKRKSAEHGEDSKLSKQVGEFINYLREKDRG